MESNHRRDFLKKASIVGAGVALSPGLLSAEPNEEAIEMPKQLKKNVNIAFIGVGKRGRRHLLRAAETEGVTITAICDIDPEAIKKSQKILEETGKSKVKVFSDGDYAFEKMLELDEIDGVIIATPWLWHTKMAVKCMRAKKYAAVEVTPANTLEECWDLVKTSEDTGMPCMILENVVFRRDVMAVRNMVKEGLFGEVVHGRCGYQHTLLGGRFRPGLKFGEGAADEARWRTQHALKRNADFYPTHGLGPIATMLDINRGNRFLYLTSTASKSVGLKDYIVEKGGEDHPYAKLPWKQGDVITTTIKTTNGETIIVTLNTSVPRPYSLDFLVQGTDGVVDFDRFNQRIFVEGEGKGHKWDDFQPWQQKYDHPLWKKYGEEAKGSGHGGMDYFVIREFINAVKEQRQPALDVYDAASWSAVVPLSEASIALNSTPQYFPDFTSGSWINRKPVSFI